MENEILSKRIKNSRENRDWYQKDVADKLHGKSNTLSGYENGTRSPDPKMLIKIADLYGVSVDYLLGRESEVSSLDYYKNKISTKFPNVDLMFKDMEILDAEDMKEVYEFIKYRISRKK